LKPAFQFRINVEENKKTTGLCKELKYLANIKGVYTYIAQAVIIHTRELIIINMAKS
jgi:hypothetical protein